MIRFCDVNDINILIRLGKLINDNFDSVNNLEDLIKNKEIIGYYDNSILVGYLVFKKCFEIVDILYIVVEPIYRNRGIGSELVEFLLNKIDCERVLLEVRCDNKNAIKLYKKFDFKIINIRQKYYQTQDGYVMELVK